MLVKYLLQECNAAEAVEVEGWLAASADNRKYQEDLARLLQQSKELAAASEVDVEAAWERFKVLRSHQQKTGGSVINLLSRRHWMVAAASLFVLMLAISALFKSWWLSEPAPQSLAMLTLQTEQGTRTDTLPDGTVVTLNKNSRLQYPARFEDSVRQVQLEGEAFFEVRRDTAHPFIIRTEDVQVRVLGTSFNVRNRNGETKVVVETGLVQVSHRSKQVKLKAGEQVKVRSTDTSMMVKPVTNVLYNYYRSHVFVCDDTPLPVLVQALNEAYDVPIEIGNPELQGLRITTTFNNESLDTIINVISETLGIRHRKKGGRIILE